MKVTVWLSRFTDALRSVLLAGGGLRGIGSPRDQAGTGMVAHDLQQDSEGSSKLIGLLVTLDTGITHLHNAFTCISWILVFRRYYSGK